MFNGNGLTFEFFWDNKFKVSRKKGKKESAIWMYYNPEKIGKSGGYSWLGYGGAFSLHGHGSTVKSFEKAITEKWNETTFQQVIDMERNQFEQDVWLVAIEKPAITKTKAYVNPAYGSEKIFQTPNENRTDDYNTYSIAQRVFFNEADAVAFFKSFRSYFVLPNDFTVEAWASMNEGECDDWHRKRENIEMKWTSTPLEEGKTELTRFEEAIALLDAGYQNYRAFLMAQKDEFSLESIKTKYTQEVKEKDKIVKLSNGHDW